MKIYLVFVPLSRESSTVQNTTNPARVVSLFRLTLMALQLTIERISRATYTLTASFQNMGVDHGGADVLMAQQLQ